MIPHLAPRQLGLEVRGGAEAIVHTVYSYISSASPYNAIVKLNFENAFNTVRRYFIFESVATYVSGILQYILSSFEAPSTLVLGPYTIPSSEGVQKGDPLGPLLFGIALSDALSGSTFTAGYLDDITLGDTIQTLKLKYLKEQLLVLVGLSMIPSVK